jgi:antitoxin (DNA-binding transcriptional repressor) of toxin-antitoxin stability system
MESVSLDYAREHLDELLRRAQSGEAVEIVDAILGTVRLQPVIKTSDQASPRKRRRFGRLAGQISVPAGMLDPMSEEELKEWYGDAP